MRKEKIKRIDFRRTLKKIKIRIRNRSFGNTQNIKTNKKLKLANKQADIQAFYYLCIRNRHFRNSGFEK